MRTPPLGLLTIAMLVFAPNLAHAQWLEASRQTEPTTFDPYEPSEASSAKAPIPPGAVELAQFQEPVALPDGPMLTPPGQYFDCPPCAEACCQFGCSHRSGLFAGFLYLRARGADASFAVPHLGFVGPGAVPMGNVGVANFDYQPGFRIGGVVALDQNSSLRGTYTKYKGNARAGFVAGPGLVTRPLLTFPGAGNAFALANKASAYYDINFQTADLDYRVAWLGDSLPCGGETCVNWIVGARFAQLDQHLLAVYPFNPPDGETQVQSNIDFSGAGLRAGLEGDRKLGPNSQLQFYGRGLINVLAGQFRANYQQTNRFNGQEAAVGWQDDRVVSILEGELGLSWVSLDGRLRLSGGYYLAAWFNTVTTPGWVHAAQNVNFVNVNNNLTFDGFIAQAEYNF